jgi:hypothetical protein
MKTYLQTAFAFVLLSVALVACPGGGGTTTPPTTNPPTTTPPTTNPPTTTPPMTTPPLTPPTATGNVPADLVGVWQYLIASGGDYRDNANGTTFSMTNGYSVQLKINAQGQFYFAQFSSGVSNSCPFVTYLEQMVGVVVYQKDQNGQQSLTLTPSQRRLDINNCTRSETRTLSNNPVQLGITVSNAQSQIGEATLKMDLTGWSIPLSLSLVQYVPTNPDQPAQPQDFQLGTNAWFDEFIGLWAPSSGSSIDFYDPQTDTFTIPPLNGNDHRWLRFTQDGYEMAKVWPNLYFIPTGPCKKDLIYYEKGTARFKTTDNVGGQGNHLLGDVRLQASDARLIVNIRDCGSDNGATRYNLKPLTSYFRWLYYAQTDVTHESFAFGCQYQPLNVWQFPTCNDAGSGWAQSLSRRQ